MPSNNKKILIIEDNEPYASILDQRFTQETFEVVIRGDGDEGIKKAIEYHPDIILIDLLLPKMNGINAIEELRKNEWGRNVPIIILTNLNPDNEILEAIIRNKPAYYLIKPEVTLNDIVNKVGEILKSKI